MRYLLAIIASALSSFAIAQSGLYNENYRPQFHFSPAKNWLNDPNGLIYQDGVYHLFYQYNPLGTKWGHMSWGHSITKDLIHWKELPVALNEINDTMIFSGSAVIDKNNSAGFAKNANDAALVAIYTAHQENRKQAQHLAFSNDKGNTWTHYDKNPVLDQNKKDFRDPQVFWYEKDKKWIMALAEPYLHQISFFASTNLKNWEYQSAFGPAGDTTGIWECPSLFLAPVVGQPDQKRWVLLVSQNSSMQYFTGDFDGKKFNSDEPATTLKRPDYGPDYYAAITYNNLPANAKPTSIGWLNSWNYANEIPTSTWRGAMSLPRELALKKDGNSWRLVQSPVPAIKNIRGKGGSVQPLSFEGRKDLSLTGQQFEIVFELDLSSTSDAGLVVGKGSVNETLIGYDKMKKTLYIDRSRSGDISFTKDFGKRYEAPLSLTDNRIKLQVFFDNSIIEVFANDGELVMTAQIFPSKTDNKVQLYSNGGMAKVSAIEYWIIGSIWK